MASSGSPLLITLPERSIATTLEGCGALFREGFPHGLHVSKMQTPPRKTGEGMTADACQGTQKNNTDRASDRSPW